MARKKKKNNFDVNNKIRDIRDYEGDNENLSSGDIHDSVDNESLSDTENTEGGSLGVDNGDKSSAVGFGFVEFSSDIGFDEMAGRFYPLTDAKFVRHTSSQLFDAVGSFYKPMIITTPVLVYKYVAFDLVYRLIYQNISSSYLLPLFPAILQENKILYGFSEDDVELYLKIINTVLELRNKGFDTIEVWGASMFVPQVYIEKVEGLDVRFIVYEPSQKLFELHYELLGVLGLQNTTLISSNVSYSSYPKIFAYKRGVYEDKTLW